MSIVSSEEDQKPTSGNTSSKLIDVNNQRQTSNKTLNDKSNSGGVDFFNDRDYYKIFLETSKEQEARLKQNSPFSGLKTW